ncbi:hypothetical protein NMG60_11031905 [Bertholletia excelsa]
MDEFTRTLPNYGTRSLSEGDRSSLSSMAGRGLELRRTYSHTVENNFVGFEDDLRKVVASLLSENKGQPTFRAVLISGMGGQGKTTLVRKVYHLPDIRRHFQGFAWASVSQQWNKKDILQRILISLVPQENKDEVRRMLEVELVRRLHDVQKKKKCLVVLDDVWSPDVWESIKPTFPSGENVESKILLTSRNNGVVSKMDDCFIHGLKLLSDEESWQLFKKVFSKSTRTDLKIDGDRENLGRQMVQHCKGLPLAIVVLGGLLKGKHTLIEWEHVHRNIGSNLKGDKYIKEVLVYSYQDLPYRLKPCFLYLGLYPEDHVIELEQLYQLWIGEGFISPEEIRGQETSMDVAQRYMAELVQRCMVQSRPNEYMGRVEHCQIHDLMRDMCLLKIKEENFLESVYFWPKENTFMSSSSVKTSSSSIAFGRSQIHRLAIYGADDMEDSSILDKLRERSHRVRSLLLFLGGSSFDQSSKLICSFTRELKFLTTLHLEGKSIHLSKRQFEKVIKKSIHLRCLSCRDCSIQEIPSSIVKLRYLQTLDLRSSSIIYIPNVLWKMKYLKHLYLSDTFKTEGKLRLEELVNLETLVGFNSDRCDIHDLCKLSNLRQLKDAQVEKDNREIINLCNNITGPNKKRPFGLQDSSILFWMCNFNSEEELKLLKQLLTGNPFIKVSIFDAHIKEMPTLSHDEISSSNLTYLRLRNLRLEKDPMPVLEKLHNLRSLLLGGPFLGKEIVCTVRGFPRLKYLKLDGLGELEEWKLEEGAMPNLIKLSIVFCVKLKMIPDGLRFVTTLQELYIHWMPREFADRLQVIDGREGEDFHKVRHIPSIRFLKRRLIQ